MAAGFHAKWAVAENQAEVTVARCAALSGARRAGLERHDQACVACQGLWQIYFEVLLLGVPVEVNRQITHR